MYSFLKAFLVLMKLLSLSQFYAPKFIESHYVSTSLATLRQLERLLRKKGKNTADVEFLRKCVIYHLVLLYFLTEDGLRIIRNVSKQKCIVF